MTNRMTEATNEQSEYTSYMYDALGRRVSEAQNRQPASHSTVKTYLPDLTSALPRDLMVFTAGQTEERNVYANGLVEKLTEALPNYAGSDGVEDVLYAHSDLLGSLTYLIKSDGSGYIAFDYGAWGEIDPSQALNDFE